MSDFYWSWLAVLLVAAITVSPWFLIGAAAWAVLGAVDP